MIWDGFLGPRFTDRGPINEEDLSRLGDAVCWRSSAFFVAFVYCPPAPALPTWLSDCLPECVLAALNVERPAPRCGSRPCPAHVERRCSCVA